ncbi:MAG TPA: response regulator transcription factor [Candidatus Avacidaminococcus intestinavium]|uniref:Response regulator transcription factor n=1 Tax=Candidatus Avacidaminococcus intestinavium TaxID=2840684 RepID=A0A9D1MRH4_9FIRM|nr:response regulator transcription factor [Candidatus Avacidaminococcus intestinavium]
MKTRVLLVDDEENIRLLVKVNLEKVGYEVIEAPDGKTALALLQTTLPDMIILDLMLPEIDGLEICRLLKRDTRTADIPLIMLTAKNDEIDRVIGLELGADDYLTKPFSQRELLARVKAVLRRAGNKEESSEELTLGPLKMNFSQYEAWLAGEKMELTPKEYELLRLLVENAGRVFSREQLLEKIWGYEYYGDTRTVDVHVRHLRSKLEKIVETADAIETVRGVGYRFAKKN